MELTRKDMLKLGVLGSAALAIPLGRAASTRQTIADRMPASQLPRPFTVPFEKPPVLNPVRRGRTTDYYRIAMKANKVPILPDGPRTMIYGYNGITPGPTIRAMRGRKSVVRQINRLPKSHILVPGHDSSTSVHLHGSASKPQYDGYANDITRPGQFKDYDYPNIQNARTLWYHDHGVHHTAENAYLGLAGMYVMHDKNELSLPIPHGMYDVPLVIKDAMFARNGNLIYDDRDHSGFMGDVILVNGRPWPRMRVERRKYRFRFLNSSISRGYRLALSSGEPMTVIGMDGGLAPHPARGVRSFRLGMAERYEVVIDFSKYKVGEKVVLQNLGLPNNVDYANTDVVMRFDVVGGITDQRNNSVPDLLNPSKEFYSPMKLKESDAENRNNPVKIELERQGGEWMINGRSWHHVMDSDYKEVVANPKLGEVQIWELENNSSGWFHPLHIHLIDFKILDRDGQKPFDYEQGPKDVAYIGEGETVRVIARFGPQEGRYMIHCHNLAHEDHDMMTQFRVGAGGPNPITADKPKSVSRMRAL